MYYNTQSQRHLPRINPLLQKRPKAAIPIVPPPDKHQANMDQTEKGQQQKYVDLENIVTCYGDACSDQYDVEDLTVSPNNELEVASNSISEESKIRSSLFNGLKKEDDGTSQSYQIEETKEKLLLTTENQSQELENNSNANISSHESRLEKKQLEPKILEETEEALERKPSPVESNLAQDSQQHDEVYLEITSQGRTKEVETTMSNFETKSSLTELSECKEISEPTVTT